MNFQPTRLITLRKSLGINKAEAARKLNMSAMGYGRYEKGEREPSFQTVSFIARTFGSTTDYLYGLSDEMITKVITVSFEEDPSLYSMIDAYRKNQDTAKRLLDYYNKLK